MLLMFQRAHSLLFDVRTADVSAMRIERSLSRDEDEIARAHSLRIGADRFWASDSVDFALCHDASHSKGNRASHRGRLEAHIGDRG